MNQAEMERLLRSADRRVGRFERMLPTLASKTDLDELESRMRRHFEVVAESLRDDIRLIAEGQASMVNALQDLGGEVKGDIAGLDRRLARLELSAR